MNRRELLGAVGAGATGVAGLLGTRARSAGEDAGTITTGTTTTSAEEDGFTGIDSSADRPFATITVGSREGVQNPENNRPHVVRVWNDSQQARTVGLRLVRDDADAPVLDRRVEFPADGFLTVRLLEPADYALTVRPGGGGGSPGETPTATRTTAAAASVGETVRIPRAQFDCNRSRTDVAVTADGQVESGTATTEAGCPPEVTGRTFTALGGSCGSADDASVSFADESVTVAGSIRAPNPCYGAQLADVSVTSADTLRVVVETTEPDGGVCAQCVASVEYETNLAFRDRVPETVEVVHRRGGETETVATVSRGGWTTTAEGTVSGVGGVAVAEDDESNHRDRT
ncbi:hypothetical protein [Halorussus sp. MSC15.2]|uniref:hypothetical protein n=1 Tax=Halorussus sp. MSC15.2 TaxID=2283638 RepID=UPI0013D0275E|nr:hypothetical protein [Halorussus sp. MSC15.2]NEU57489.1 hypothetical protein [Halorussus sp. MSC15.2]